MVAIAPAWRRIASEPKVQLVVLCAALPVVCMHLAARYSPAHLWATRHLLTSGRPRVHEPAYDPDPDHYVTWEYARGYADGVHDTLTEGTDDDHS